MIDPNDYWVNNPLITPANKALMYDNDIDKAKHDERERIIALLGREMGAMRASRSPSDWEQSYGVEIAIGLIDGGHE